MIVLRKTMEAEVQKARADMAWAMGKQYGEALERVSALQKQMAAWVMKKSENITPEQAAQMFYAQDDSWQAAFFNVMQAQVIAHHESLPPARPHEFRFSAGSPAGEAQWWHATQKLNESGFETLRAMFEHAAHHRGLDVELKERQP